jgi:hypothetical protein
MCSIVHRSTLRPAAKALQIAMNKIEQELVAVAGNKFNKFGFAFCFSVEYNYFILC